MAVTVKQVEAAPESYPLVPGFAGTNEERAMICGRYYREKVIGGPNAFVMVAKDYASFGQAMTRKLVVEIAALPITQGSANARTLLVGQRPYGQ